MMPGMGRQGPLCPCLLKCPAQAIQGSLHPSISQGNASNPPAGQGNPLHCRPAQAHSHSSHGRCQCSQALPGSRDLMLLCQGGIFQKMCTRQQKSLSGKEQLEETSCRHSGAGTLRDREWEPETGLQSRGTGEDREQPELAVRQQGTETFQRRLHKVC